MKHLPLLAILLATPLFSLAQETATGRTHGITNENTRFIDLELNAPMKSTELYRVIIEHQEAGIGDRSAFNAGCWMCWENWHCERKEIWPGVEYFQYRDDQPTECGKHLKETLYYTYHGNAVRQVSMTTFQDTIYEFTLMVEARNDIPVFDMLKYWYGEGEIETHVGAEKSIRWHSEDLQVICELFPFTEELGAHYRIDYMYLPTQAKLKRKKEIAEKKAKDAKWRSMGIPID